MAFSRCIDWDVKQGIVALSLHLKEIHQLSVQNSNDVLFVLFMEDESMRWQGGEEGRTIKKHSAVQ